MSSVCLFLSIHEPVILRHYSVFDLGQNSLYEDDERNCSRIQRLADSVYLPTMKILLDQVKRLEGKFRFACHISLPALDLFEQYAPEVITKLNELAETDAVEFVAGAAHSLAFLYSEEEFCRQLSLYSKRVQNTFGKKPTCFCSTELIYNNDFARCLSSMGYRCMLAEGADHILGWRSPNFVYEPENVPDMRLLLRNRSLSRDISLRFSNKSWDMWPLTAEKYASWCAKIKNCDVINIFLNMNVFGLIHDRSSGIFEFLEHLPASILDEGLRFSTPNDAITRYNSRDSIDVHNFISWDDAGGDLNSWLGNDMQKDAVHFLYSLTDRVHKTKNPDILKEFTRLQTSNYLQWMSTKWFASSNYKEPSPFVSPQEAYVTYMNILADFEIRLQNIIAKIDVSASKNQTKQVTRSKKTEKKSVQTEQKTFTEDKQLVA
ncbi:MAG: glycoside hydrolase family 57 protein [Desulfovibrio sp.]|nr:glycoside hydrolase family 57 protein [Desulfovibrio sp.]